MAAYRDVVAPEFQAWCEAGGVVQNGIAAAFVADGWRGIVATRELQPGDTVLQVPERLLLTTRSAQRDPVLAPALARHHPPLTPHQVLACHLLHEVSKGPDSFWHPYLRQLPRSYTSLANFAPEEVEQLQVRHAVEVAEAAVERAREEWEGARPLLRELGLPARYTCLRAWRWASSTLHSRTMYTPWCPAGALTPYGDLHNYQPPRAPYTPQLGGGHTARVEGGRQQGGTGAGRRGEQQGGQVGEEVQEPGRSGLAQQEGAVGGEGAGARGAGVADAAGPAGGCLAERGQAGGEACGSGACDDTGGGAGSGSGSCCVLGGGGEAQLADALARSRLGHGGVPGAEQQQQQVGGGEQPEQQQRPVGGGEQPEQQVGAAASERCSGAQPEAPGGEGADGPDASGEDEWAMAGDGSWDERGRQYCITVRRPYRAGEQVFLCYGRYTNLELLEHYGFVLEDNPHDSVLLDPALLPVPAAARHSPGAPYLAHADCFLHANGQPSWQLLHFLRYCAATPVQRRTQGHVLAAGGSIDAEGEHRVLGWLQVACSAHLAGLGTTAEQDERAWRAAQQLPAGEQQARGQEQQHDQQQQEGGPRHGRWPQWRLLQKRIVHRAVLLVEEAGGRLAGAGVGAGYRAAPPVDVRELQRRARQGMAAV